MGLRLPPVLGKVLYALLFGAAFPAALGLWAKSAERHFAAQAVRAPGWGLGLAGAGAALMAAGMVWLWVVGKGLPMNPYPPKRRVDSGVFRLVGHPIYVGFVLASAGASLWAGSGAGLWLVTPAVALGATALVLGYEGPDLERRLGQAGRHPLLGCPPASLDRPTGFERLGALCSCLVAPGLTLLALHGLEGAAAGFGAHERTGIRVLGAAPLVLVVGQAVAWRTLAEARASVVRAWLACGLLGLAAGGGWPPAPDVALVTLAGLNALPALARRRAPVWLAGGALVAAAVLAPGGANLEAGALALAAFALAHHRLLLWRALRRAAEVVANSWRERQWGGLRLINHGTWAALGCGAGIAYATVLAGPAHAWAVFGAAASAIVGSALWAQFIEGSPALARPYGFFGGLLGISLFAVVAGPWMSTPTWGLLGTFATAGPMVQGLGRIRCLANGCCHGSPCPAWLGLVYRNPHTRVVKLTSFGGTPVHPTQLYSLLSNAVIGVVQLRLWLAGWPFAFLGGTYLMLMGLARFVEEAYRGEPQTPVLGGLRLYQWVSLACVLVGAGLTCVPDSPRPGPLEPSVRGLFAALAFAALTWGVASIDFPRSKRRFARLA